MNTPPTSIKGKALIISASALVALLAVGFAAAIAWGGPAPIVPLASINEPFAKVDFSTVPAPSQYTARNGTAMAWHRYPAAGSLPNARRIVLVHGSSARARSMHVLASALAAAGFDVAALDMRGHGDSGPRGQADYIGQLEDDVEDFMRAVLHPGPSTLLGFSSGGGFALRFAGGTRQALFDRYVLLSPYLHHTAPTNRSGSSGWVSVDMPRMVALMLLNVAGVRVWNDLPVLRFGLNDVARKSLTSSYSDTLATSFGPHNDYLGDIRGMRGDVRLLAGSDDELFDASQFAGVFAGAGRAVPVTLVPGVDPMGLTLDAAAVQAVARACAG